MLTQGEYLENTLGSEDADEAHVEVLQSEDPHLRLTIVIQRHGQHVEANEDHDYHIKLLVSDDPEDDRLRPPLQVKRGQSASDRESK